MNPLLMQALGSVIRFGLAFVAGYLIRANIWTADEATTYINAATETVAFACAMALTSLIWSLWNKYKGRLHLLTALAYPVAMPESHMKQLVAKGMAPSALTSEHVVPLAGTSRPPQVAYAPSVRQDLDDNTGA